MLFALLVSPALPATGLAHRIEGEAPDAIDWDAWGDFVRPTAEESRFEELEWVGSFGAGIEKANQVRKPLLLWIMNGHPLGCT